MPPRRSEDDRDSPDPGHSTEALVELETRLAELTSKAFTLEARLSSAIRAQRPGALSRSAPEPSPPSRPRDSATSRERARRALAALDACAKRERACADHEIRNADEWERRAALAVRAGDHELAREALLRRDENRRSAATYGAEAELLEAELRELSSFLKSLPDPE